MSSNRGGIAYIAGQQRRGGGFAAYRIDDGKASSGHYTTFVPVLIGLALLDVEGSVPIRRRLTRFLLKQKNEDWAWNYWDRTSVQASETPYPDDLDCTFLALVYLWHEDQSLFSPEIMARIVNLLFVTEVAAGGPYVTWITEDVDEAWRDIDVIVNGNVAAFLALRGVSLAQVTELVERAIESGKLASPYYPGLLPGAYLVARWYRGSRTVDLCEYILATQYGNIWGNAHQTALAVSALLRLGYPAKELESAIEYIKRMQKSDGSWDFGGMYIVDVEYGAPALTTAVCLEAIALYERYTRPINPQKTHTKQIETMFKGVIKEIDNTTKNINQSILGLSIEKATRTVISGSTGRQIVAMPYMVYACLDKKAHVSAKTLQGLALTSVWGWTAYTIFDDFLDEEGDVSRLPAAQFAYRQMLSVAKNTLPGNGSFQDEINDILTRIDAANAWEVAHCRGKVFRNRLFIDILPDYDDLTQLADRSLGHGIAALGVLYGAGYKADSQELRGIRRFFHHYLIARQLNDDAHDWQDDLARGHVNAVAVRVLDRWLKKRPERSLSKGIDLRRQKEALQLLLWEEVIEEVCATTNHHIHMAKRALHRMPNFNGSHLSELLDPLENAANQVRQSRDEALTFIANL